MYIRLAKGGKRSIIIFVAIFSNILPVCTYTSNSFTDLKRHALYNHNNVNYDCEIEAGELTPDEYQRVLRTLKYK